LLHPEGESREALDRMKAQIGSLQFSAQQPILLEGDRLEYPDLRRKIIALGTKHAAETILIENAGPGMNLIQDLRADLKKPIVNPIPIKPEGSKVDRMVAQSAKIEAGHVYLPKGAPLACDISQGAPRVSKWRQ
jgi:phage terminase large subunit-like protein